MRAKVTKASLDTLAADRRAEVEAQLSAIYRADEEAWRDITANAQRVIDDASAQIARICETRRIPEGVSTRPRAELVWPRRQRRGGASGRTAEVGLRADRRRPPGGRAVGRVVGRGAVNLLLAGALASRDAKAFLAALPSPEVLLPPLRLTQDVLSGPVTDGLFVLNR